MASAVHGHRSVRGLGGGPRRRLRRCPNAWASMPLIHGPSLSLGHLSTGRRRSRRKRYGHSSVQQQQRGRRRRWLLGQGSEGDVRLQAPRIGLQASTSTTLAPDAKQARWPMPPAARAVGDAERLEIGEGQGRRCQVGPDLLSRDRGTGDERQLRRAPAPRNVVWSTVRGVGENRQLRNRFDEAPGPAALRGGQGLGERPVP
jgi:hypothetical protein